MGLIKLFQVCICLLLVVLLQTVVESVILVRFDRAPPARSKVSTAVFRFSVLRPDGSSPCKKDHECSLYCEVDGQTLRHCPISSVILKNLTGNQEHYFLLNVTTSDGERTSANYKWFIDTIPPTASIVSERTYTNAAESVINITFSEACIRQGGFKCVNSSSCDVLVNGPAYVNVSTLRMVEPDIKYSLVIVFSSKSTYGRVVIAMADRFCTDQAGNPFARTDSSVLIIHFDRRPVQVDMWTSVPSYELKIRKVPRTVLATNKLEDLNFFLDFNDSIMNSTKEIQSVLHANSGKFIPIHSKSQGNSKFAFRLRNVSKIEIITTKLQFASIIGRFIEISKELYSLTVMGTSHSVVVSVCVPEGKVNDVAGNLNFASNRIEVKQYSSPAISVALHSFVTAGLLATSLAAAVLSLSSTNLGAIEALTSGTTSVVVSDPSMNLLGMVGHLQVFVLSDWISAHLPIEYSETIKGLRWLIPREKIPWKKTQTSLWYNYDSSLGSNDKLLVKPTESVSGITSFHGHHNVSMRNIQYGLPLDSNEYLTYFLREEPLSALNVVKEMENYTGWQDLEMNLFWLGIGGGGLLVTHFLILAFLRWRTRTAVHVTLSFPRFVYFLLILMLPCISQSSAFVIKGGTTGGIITGALLLAIPAALILSVSLFLIVAIFTSGFVQYKEIRHMGIPEPWHAKIVGFLAGRATTGKWFYFEGLPLSFLPRFGFLFEDKKGPPVIIKVDHNDPNNVPKWIENGQTGIGRMRAVNFGDNIEETKIPESKKVIGCARSSYSVLDLLRRVGLGIISGIYSSRRPSQSILALVLTVFQLFYLFTLKPYISRGIHAVESVSLLCEAAMFGLAIYIYDVNMSNEVKHVGFLMLALLLIIFVSQLVNEWYALIRCLFRLSQSRKPSFKLGLKFLAKGLILPFLPRKYWSRFVPGSSQPRTGLVPGLPQSSETELGMRQDLVSAMTATIVPILSPGSPSVTNARATSPTAQTSMGMRSMDLDQQKGTKLGSRSELRKLRDLARASFSGSSKVEEGNCSYSPQEQCNLDRSF
ncbi:hypothetical protein GIB67_002868 [Kingdonia uniflora]|uniref:Transmembrane protein n=1 Tax=Kingdonia uniflora TaxID=39325 RepID=A0A7J7M5E6_9MAGN|nr:hypothetical protein GIB67_002868 [Kingdonia uniflora]